MKSSETKVISVHHLQQHERSDGSVKLAMFLSSEAVYIN